MFTQRDFLSSKDCDSLVEMYKSNIENTFRLDWDWESRYQRLLRIDPNSDLGKDIFYKLSKDQESVCDDLRIEYFDAHLIEIFISKYVEGEGVDWHNDRVMYEYERPYINERVYNFSINLNDEYTGGNVWVDGKEVPMNKGTCTYFSILYKHCVRPVTSGERYSLIGWMYKKTLL